MEKAKIKAVLCHSYQIPIPSFYQTKKITSNYVSDGLENEIDSWSPPYPVLIDAPTGLGKNTFILKECIPRAYQAGKNILIISNRVALSSQQKIIILKSINSIELERLTPKGICEQEDFGNIKIITYHRLKTFFSDEENDKWRRNLQYVILDEAHFFVADSLFNEWCGYYLDQIVRKFSNAIRIYMTATSWDVLYPIAEAEKHEYFEVVKPPYFRPPRYCMRYYFQRTFENYKLNFISDISELSSLIENSGEAKWLVFIDNKEKGKKFVKALNAKCDYLDSNYKNGALWNQIVNQSSFNAKVLVTTSVLDNGINIVDKKLTNIVVFTDSRTSLIQMLGRKRYDSADKINVWVCDITYEKAQKNFKEYKNLYSWFESFDNCHYEYERNALASQIWSSDNPQLRKLFRISGGKLLENKMARLHIMQKLDFYKNIVERKTTFQNCVKEWLNKPLVLPHRYFDKLNCFCDEHLGIHLSESECEELRFLVVKSYEEAGNKELQKSRLNELKPRALNTRIKALGLNYKIDYIKQVWVLSKYDTEDSYDLSNI